MSGPVRRSRPQGWNGIGASGLSGPAKRKRDIALQLKDGGERGIRTLGGGVTASRDFQSRRFNHSRISPRGPSWPPSAGQDITDRSVRALADRRPRRRSRGARRGAVTEAGRRPGAAAGRESGGGSRPFPASRQRPYSADGGRPCFEGSRSGGSSRSARCCPAQPWGSPRPRRHPAKKPDRACCCAPIACSTPRARRRTPGWVVLVTGNTIAAVGPAAQVKAPAGTQTIDLPGTTLLPGLIEAHSHVFLHPYDETLWNDQVLKEPLAYRTIAATLHCERTLQAGFTTLRDLGTEGAGYADLSLKRAIDEGRIPGPRLLVATLAIVATASYGPGPPGFAPEFVPPKGAQEATGVAEIVQGRARAGRPRRGRGEGLRRLPPRARRHRCADLLARGAESAGRRGAQRRAPGGGARRHGRGHAARDARRRRTRSSTATARRRTCSR